MEPAPYWITGYADASAARIPVVSTDLNGSDKAGALKVRLGIARDSYMVPPGLYAVGKPVNASPVLVTANYKLAFDSLRAELSGLDAWILVLDTKGINVWCAAGKGTFGTAELSGRVNALQLKRLVSHNVLILPQLGAPGVSAHEVFRLCGFRVVYGPVRASDIKDFLINGMKAEGEMRQVKFELSDRLAVAPIELMHSVKPMTVIYFVLLVLNLLVGGHTSLGVAAWTALLNFLPYLAAFIIGCIAVPALLPWIPFNSFALKGLLLGLLPAALVLFYPGAFGYADDGWLLIVGCVLALTVISSFLALNFTGSTTYTSFSGVKKETRYSLPFYISASVLVLLLYAADTAIKLLY